MKKILGIMTMLTTFTAQSYATPSCHLERDQMFANARAIDLRAVEVKDQLFKNWNLYTQLQRETLDNRFWTLTTQAMQLRTKAVSHCAVRN